MRVRTTKTGSSAIAVQVVRYEYGNTVVIKHFGSANSEREIAKLKQQAFDWISQVSHQQSFFQKESSFEPLFLRYQNLGVRYTFLYEVLTTVIAKFEFDHLDKNSSLHQLLLDLVLIRIVQPSSKLRSCRLLSELFGINYDITTVYKSLKQIAVKKESVETSLVKFAQDNLHFDFSFVLYDVTTLYYESFKADEDILDETTQQIIDEGLRKPGFSKDHKAEQPQVVIGLLVDDKGFPLSFSTFPGNKFEGHTLIPVITSLRQKYNIPTLTVVADSSMISKSNIKELKSAQLNFIVGARLGYFSLRQLTTVSESLNQTDGKTIRLNLNQDYLICDFSAKRYAKDKSDTEKQIKKAQALVDGKLQAKRLKFLTGEKTDQQINQPLIDRTKLGWGIKGYITNLNLKDQEIIDRYHNLWQVERAFRMSKTDLLMRPIFHFKKEAIEAHILICVMALAVAKFMEVKSNSSIRVILEELKKVIDTRVVNIATGEEALWRSVIPEKIKQVLEAMEVTY